MWFDRLVQIIDYFKELLLPWVVVNEYEKGVILLLGKFSRTLDCGFHWKWPLLEVPSVETVVRRTTYMDVQSLTSRDGQNVNISPIIVWSIGNVRKFLLEVDEGESAIADTVYGVTDEVVSETNWDQIRAPEFAEEVTRRSKKTAVDWGCRIHSVKFSDRAKGRAVRLWTNRP